MCSGLKILAFHIGIYTYTTPMCVTYTHTCSFRVHWTHDRASHNSGAFTAQTDTKQWTRIVASLYTLNNKLKTKTVFHPFKANQTQWFNTEKNPNFQGLFASALGKSELDEKLTVCLWLHDLRCVTTNLVCEKFRKASGKSFATQPPIEIISISACVWMAVLGKTAEVQRLHVFGDCIWICCCWRC